MDLYHIAGFVVLAFFGVRLNEKLDRIEALLNAVYNSTSNID